MPFQTEIPPVAMQSRDKILSISQIQSEKLTVQGPFGFRQGNQIIDKNVSNHHLVHANHNHEPTNVAKVSVELAKSRSNGESNRLAFRAL
jgi:hypothetical protein